MSQLTEEKCRYYLARLAEAKRDALGRSADYDCECAQSAKAVQGALLKRIRLGDEDALDELLSYYRCFDDWKKEVFDDPEWRSVVLAMVKTRLIGEHVENFANRLRVVFIQASIEIFRHRLEQILLMEQTRALDKVMERVMGESAIPAVATSATPVRPDYP